MKLASNEQASIKIDYFEGKKKSLPIFWALFSSMTHVEQP